MKLLTIRFLSRTCFPFATGVAISALAMCTPVFAQHGGGHAAGGGHFGGGGHAGTPHVSAPVTSAPPAPHVVIGGPGRFVAPPPVVHLIPRPGTSGPVVGNHVMMPPVLPPVTGPRIVGVGPHTVVGFPRTGSEGGAIPLHFSPVMSFSGQGHDLWQDSVEGAPRSGVRDGAAFAGRMPRGPHTPPFPIPRRPVFPGRPIFPIFGPPGFGFFGSPFFGLGLGFGFGSLWWPSCGPYWGWGYGCNGLSYYDYGPGYELGYNSNNLEAQVESQSGPEMYEYPSATSPIFVYGEEERELAQLYLKDGTVYNVTDYWLVNDQIHCTTVEGATSVEHIFNFDELNLQKTIDVNTARGFKFVLRNEPIEQYLRDHPDAGGSGAGVMQPSAPPQPATPSQPPSPPSPPQP